MGAWCNLKIWVDYSTREHAIELHRHFILDQKTAGDIKTALDSGQIDEARQRLKSVTPENAHRMIDEFFDYIKSGPGKLGFPGVEGGKR